MTWVVIKSGLDLSSLCGLSCIQGWRAQRGGLGQRLYESFLLTRGCSWSHGEVWYLQEQEDTGQRIKKTLRLSLQTSVESQYMRMNSEMAREDKSSNGVLNRQRAVNSGRRNRKM